MDIGADERLEDLEAEFQEVRHVADCSWSLTVELGGLFMQHEQLRLKLAPTCRCSLGSGETRVSRNSRESMNAS
jgi:hypothetical protein